MKTMHLPENTAKRILVARARARNVEHSAGEAVDLATDKYESDLPLYQKRAYVEYARAFVDLAREVRKDVREIEAEAREVKARKDREAEAAAKRAREAYENDVNAE